MRASRCLIASVAPLVGMKVSAFVDNPSMSKAIASGTITAQLDAHVFAVTMENVTVASPVIEVGSRVVVRAEDKSSAGGLVAKIHPNGSFAVLRDDDVFLHNVSRSSLSVVDVSSLTNQSETFSRVVKWIRDAGVARKADAQSAATILFRRGWRANKLYLLENADVHCLHHLNKSVRMGILEAADAERDRARYERESRKEQLKEADWRYYVFKYSSVFGAATASFGACSVFMWNLKNWRKAQRPAQVETAANLWRASRPQNGMKRRDEDRFVSTLQALDSRHPRLIIVTSNDGVGSAVVQTAAAAAAMPFVSVELRGNERLDPVRSLAKTLGAANLDVCGDLYTFVEDVAHQVTTATNQIPIVLFKLSDSSTGYVYDDAIALACERRVCHVMIEVEHEEAKRNLLRLPRTELFQIQDLTPEEAKVYLAKRVDPVFVNDFLESVGTSISELDELVGASRNKNFDIDDFIAAKLGNAVALLKGQSKDVHNVLREVCSRPYDVGLATPSAGVEEALQKELLSYNAERDVWVFRSKLMHEGARIAFA